jgi:uncharacterized Tic20 family protein
MTLGTYIKKSRIEKGMTQEDLSEKTDLSVRTIQRIENDEVDARTFTLQAIASALEVDYNELCKYQNQDTNLAEKKYEHTIWYMVLHLSGLFILIIPPIIIWLWKKDKIKGLTTHAHDVINFQLSMFLYFMIGGFLVLLAIGIPIVIFLGIFSFVVIVVNSIKVLNNQPYKYPWTIKILK